MIFLKKDTDEIFQQIYVLNVLICRITTCWEFLYFFGLCDRFLVVVGQNRAVLVASVIWVSFCRAGKMAI